MRRHGRLAAAGHAGNQDARTFVVSFALQHLIEIGDAARQPLDRRLVGKAARRNRHHSDALFVDDERVFVGAVGRAAILDDAQAARGKLIVDAVVEQDDAVGDVFLQAVARQCAFAALAGDDGGDAPGLEPLEQPAQFGAQHLLVFQAAEERLDGVHNNALGADRVRWQIRDG